MQQSRLTPGWHRLLAAGLVLVLVAASGCQSVLSSFTSEGASRSSEGNLADIRSSRGLPPLQPDARLEQAARQQAGYMASAGKMTHTTSWSRGFSARMRSNGVRGAAAENIAQGNMDQARLFGMWMNSAGHRRNMLDPAFTKFGLASATNAKGERYWALVLGQ